MSRTWVLLKAQILDFFPINELQEPGNKKKNMVLFLYTGFFRVLAFYLCYGDPFANEGHVLDESIMGKRLWLASPPVGADK